MYLEHFDLKAFPFESTPDPAFFFMGAQYRDILSAMIHSVVSRKGLMVLSAPVGSGKTILGRTATTYLPDGMKVISLVHPQAAKSELLSFVASKLGVENVFQPHLFLVEEIKDALTKIHQADGRCAVLIDEAQLLSEESLEEIRLLTNMETDKAKLVQIILMGQDELVGSLRRPEVRQLWQRVSLFKTLAPMDRPNTIEYIRHRLKTAGGDPDLFTINAMDRINIASGGIPRTINQLCDAALMNAFQAGNKAVDDVDIARIEAETVGEKVPQPNMPTNSWDEHSEAQVDQLKPKPRANIQPHKTKKPSAKRPLTSKNKSATGWAMALSLLTFALVAMVFSVWFYLQSLPPETSTLSAPIQSSSLIDPAAESKGSCGNDSAIT